MQQCHSHFEHQKSSPVSSTHASSYVKMTRTISKYVIGATSRHICIQYACIASRRTQLFQSMRLSSTSMQTSTIIPEPSPIILIDDQESSTLCCDRTLGTSVTQQALFPTIQRHVEASTPMAFARKYKTFDIVSIIGRAMDRIKF